MLWKKGFLVSLFFFLVLMSLSLLFGSYYSFFIFFIVFFGLLLFCFLFYHFHSSKRIIRDNVDDRVAMLRAYLKKALLSGYDDNRVLDSLVSAGWDERLVKKEIHKLRFFWLLCFFSFIILCFLFCSLFCFFLVCFLVVFSE